MLMVDAVVRRLYALKTLARYRYLGKHFFAAVNRMKLRLPLRAGNKLAGLRRIDIQDILVQAFDRRLDGHFRTIGTSRHDRSRMGFANLQVEVRRIEVNRIRRTSTCRLANPIRLR